MTSTEVQAGNDTLTLLKQLETALVQHEEALNYLISMQEEMQQQQQSMAAWQGFNQAPPYSIRFADDLRAEHQSLLRQQQATASRIRIVSREIDEAGEQFDQHQRAERQYREDASDSIESEDSRNALLAAQREALLSRIEAENLARLKLRRDSQTTQQDALTAALKLTDLKIDAVRGKVEFTAAERDENLQRIEQEKADLLSAMEAAAQDPSRDAKQLTWKIEFLSLEKEFWSELHIALNSDDKDSRQTAIENLEGIEKHVDDWVELLRLQTREMAGGLDQGIGQQASLSDMQRVLHLSDLVSYSLEELQGEGARGLSLMDRSIKAALDIWDSELYLAEETSSVGGNKVTTYRAVTLGKIIRLTFILTLGWFVLGYLSRRITALLAARPGMQLSTAESAGSWTFGVGLTILLIYGLNKVHIPFTAFAFLGGTLAIGIGFGAQTVLKNFISGIILKLERPFKVGDLVDVDNITGKIQRIGLRASVIRHFDGIDSLVPNSTLLENRVSNWTFGDTALRGAITVGVAYGSPTRQVGQVLLHVAEQHGLVLSTPKPEVRFEEFGDNALQFRLLYWFDAERTQRDPLASDLRYMIDGALAEAGIVISFPQRDIHFDETRPLRVEIARPAIEND